MIKKKIAGILFLLLSFTNYFAQSNFRIGGNFNVNVPTGNFADIAKTGFGGTLSADYFTSNNSALSFSSSYVNIPINVAPIGIGGKAIDFTATSYNILFGGKYFFSRSFFSIVQAGVAFWKLNLNYFDSPSNTVENLSSDYYSYFSAYLGGGYRYNLAKNKSDAELSVGYNYTNGDSINYNLIVISAGLFIYF